MGREDEIQICAETQHEGFGSVYERVMLNRLLHRLQDEHPVKTVVEFRSPFVKGFDNIAFLSRGCQVTVHDERAGDLERLWPFGDPAPRYAATLEDDEAFDLAWNFAAFQLGTFQLAEMIRHSRRYVLIFTPNVLNLGTPFHVGYHLLSLRKCTHAEQGAVRTRMRSGLVRLARRSGLDVVDSGYVDVPWWPDTAFSIREFKRYVLRMKRVSASRQAGSVQVRDAEEVLDDIERAAFIENKRFLRPFFAHHCYVLLERAASGQGEGSAAKWRIRTDGC